MEISLADATLLFSSGVLLFAILCMVHFASTYNRHNRSLAFLSAIIVGNASIYHISNLTGYGLLESVEYGLAIAIMGFISLYPFILAILSVVLFRISLLTSWSVDASS